MNPVFRLFAKEGRRGALGVLLAAGLLAGCRHDVLIMPAYDDYFPVVVGSYRTYAVADSTWVSGRATVANYQFRERVSEQFTDAAGKTAFRLVRSKRASAAAAWADDSAFVVQPLPRAVLLTRNNVRTVELIYPARASKGWNYKAFTASPDTITSLTRYYGPSVAVPYTTPAVPGAPAKTYDNTVSTKTTLDGGAEEVNLIYQRGLRQVYASSVGLVLRRRFSYNTFVTNQDGSQTLTPGIVQSGQARRETLIESGTL
ncbi:hypothetical protein QMK33_11985 [Hymenobacter sp. H14-R3]|uniref:hypothetical protein n=1 Tax=Hymenobacter sp. H14-R3 TaxID=3046308 RepID=UPI0024BABF63|nr:hypothetical protein [Hymenobacter sp. H14-R3]MDJ0365874.1 hypothetical protein [Hymenobacter sp. H14-R3]